MLILYSNLQRQGRTRFIMNKVVGFVDELTLFFGLPIESTNEIFWKMHHKSNPQIESFEHSRPNQIHETNLLNTIQIRESKSSGFVHLEYIYVLKIRKDLSDLLVRVLENELNCLYVD